MIPKQLLNEILQDNYYEKCVRHKEGTCRGRITFEHAIQYASKQVQEKWSIIPLCSFHHAVNEYQDRGDLNKEINWYYALQRATETDLEKYPRRNWKQLKKYLVEKYGQGK